MSSKTEYLKGRKKITEFIFTTLFFLLLIAATTTSTTVFAPAVNYGTGPGTSPVSVATCDFNGDSVPDVATANYGDGSVSILLGKADGTFQAAKNYPIGTGINPDSIICGDFNGDGKMDLATANSSNDNISVLLGNGDSTFQAAVTYGTGMGTSPISITVGDFNQDGKLDLATANVNSSEVSILLGNSDGTFQAVSNYSVGLGSNPYSIIAGDFNGDGKLDIATANAGSNDVSVLLGHGAGTFQAPVICGTGNGVTTGITPLSIITGDFNGDGKLDLATANNSNDMTVLLGNGDGSFKTAVNYAAGNSPVAITLGDFNADGKTDLVAANVLDNNLSVFLGNGDGIFQPASNYAVGNLPYAVITGDFNKDGRPDLAVANNGDNTVSVLIGVINPKTYSISGTITTTGASQLAGVTVNLSGSATATTITDASGNYSFADLQNGTYTVIPALTGQMFTPANITITVSDANKPSVNFIINPHTITATSTTCGTITPQGERTIIYGADQEFTITPSNERCYLVDVLVDGESVGQKYSYSFNNVTADHTIKAVFEAYPARIAGTTPVYYLTLQAAYDAAPDGATIQTRDFNVVGSLDTKNRSITINLQGGYNSDFTIGTGVTTLNGTMTINSGSVTIQNFILQ